MVYCNLHFMNNHHTVQVVICTLVNALVLRGRTPPVQVAAGDDHHECKWNICASWWNENTTSASCTVSRLTWAEVYRSGMQQPNAGSTRARFALMWCPCPLVVVLVVVFLCCGDGGCIYMMVVVVHGGFAAVTQPRMHLEERSPLWSILCCALIRTALCTVRGYDFCLLRNLESQKMSMTTL